MNEKLLKALVKKDVLRFGDFTLKSGRKSPYFFNAGNINDGEALEAVGEAYADLIMKNNIQFDVVFGPAYKGIPLAATIVQALHRKYGMIKRFAYDRKETKEYGDRKDKMIVGRLEDGDRILMVDDVVTTGLTKFQTIEKLNSLGKKLKIKELVILFDRQEAGDSGKSAVQDLQNKGLNVYSAMNAFDTFNHLHNREIDGKVHVDDGIYNRFKEYYAKYGAFYHQKN